MHFDLIQSLSLAGKPEVPNDDRIGCADQHAWVIDGATDLGPPGLLGERGGAAWLAAAAQRAFHGASGALQQVCESVFVAVALEGAELSCAYMGDCVVLHRSAQGIGFLTPEPDREAERAEAAALGPGTGAFGVRTPAVVADRRAARERPKAVLSIDAQQARDGTRYVRSAVSVGDEVILMSDGFAALFDTYDVYDPAGFIAQLEAHGLAALAQTLRAIEQEDAACLRYPRFKASDDASAIWLRVA